MPRFLALTSRGLLEPLVDELNKNGLKRVTLRPHGVEFEASWANVAEIHRKSRLATRFLMPVLDFEAYNEADLYSGLFKRHDFTSYISPRQTIRVEAHTRDHRVLTDQRFVALKVKDAIVDQFWKKFDERPNVGTEEEADLRVVVRIVGPKVSVAIDLTGASLSVRGYRKVAGEAPLREHLACGLLRLADWQPPRVLVDPFCGSGTILIEAALDVVGYSAQFRQRDFAFQHLQKINQQLASFKPTAKSGQPMASPRQKFIFGYDRDASVIAKARANAKAAGVSDWIEFAVQDVKDFMPPAEVGMMVTNPPYGERLEDTEKAKALMNDFSAVLKSRCKGWDVFILNANAEAIKGLRLKANRKFPVWNAQLDCRLLHYPIR